MTTPTDIKFVDYHILKLLNERSVEQDRVKNFFFDRLPIDEKEYYPITVHFPQTILHTNGVSEDIMRIRLVLNQKGETGWLDITPDEYELLPTMITPKYMLDAYEALAKAQLSTDINGESE